MVTSQDLYTTKVLVDCVSDYLKPLTETGGFPKAIEIETLLENHEKISCLCTAITDRLWASIDIAVIEENKIEKNNFSGLINLDLDD